MTNESTTCTVLGYASETSEGKVLGKKLSRDEALKKSNETVKSGEYEVVETVTTIVHVSREAGVKKKAPVPPAPPVDPTS